MLADGQASYQYGAGLVSEVRGGVSKAYHADALGTTRAMSNSAGVATDTLETDAFGNTVSKTGTIVSPFGFAGQSGYQTDADSGLMRLGYRFYDASVGRFISRDPAFAGYNWYIYCENDPVNGIDPEGLQTGFVPDWGGPAQLGPTPKMPLPGQSGPNPGTGGGQGTIILGGIEAIWELINYTPGHPSGPLTTIGDTVGGWIGDILYPPPAEGAPYQPLPRAKRVYFGKNEKKAKDAASDESVRGYPPVKSPDEGHGKHYHPGGPGDKGRHPTKGHDHYFYD